MSTSKKTTKAQTLANVQALIVGTQKHTPNAQVTFGNVTYTTASLVQLFESLVDAMTAQNAAQVQAKDAVLAARETSTKVDPVLSGYRKYLLALYGNASQTLADYGLVPTKAPKPLSAEAMLAKTELNRATREKRGTVGPKKRLAIKGTVAVTAEPSAQPAIVPAKPTA